VVIIHTGDNGVISRTDLLSTLSSLRQAERVVLVTVRVPRDWEKPNNRLLTSVAAKFGNVVLLDWHKLSAAHPSWFYNDGIHLRPDGARSYAALVRTIVEDGRVGKS
jgi:hypothetical protein